METNNQKSFYCIIESDVIFNKNLTSTEKILYSIISSYSNNERGYCFLTYNQLANIIGLSRRQFYYCLNNLITNNYIKKIINPKNNRISLAPTINLLSKCNKDNPEKFKDIYTYDWLNSNDDEEV